MRRIRVVVRVKAGPSWKSGPPENQPGWEEHNDFIDRLVADGTIVMGGPFSDYSGSLLLFERVTPDEAGALMAADPFVHNGVFVIEDIRDWTVYVDSLT
jgi:uncharacterized protein YciI